MRAYSALPPVYGELMSDFDRGAYTNKLREWGIKGRGVDYGCGDGEMTVRLAAMGLNVIGIDPSINMIEQAFRRTRELGYTLPYAVGGIKAADGADYDFIVAACDVMNYVSHKKLRVTIQSMLGKLRRGGLLVFDVSTEYKLLEKIGTNTFYVESDGACYVWNSFKRGKILDVDLTLFVRGGNGLYERKTEEHRMYAHSLQTVTEALTGAKICAMSMDTFGKARKNCDRLIFKAVKE